MTTVENEYLYELATSIGKDKKFLGNYVDQIIGTRDNLCSEICDVLKIPNKDFNYLQVDRLKKASKDQLCDWLEDILNLMNRFSYHC